ncbi:FAD-dependent monooxygenase [Sphingobacterium sp. KU25419]|nr:FAD-dependent monooxygenase [Sphingobacterium sp. KU25419]
MKIQDKKIAIVGGGPGGLTLARLLQLKGLNVCVYERDINKDARLQGSPLDLHTDSGMAAIINADLLSEFKNNFLPKADRLKILDEQANVFFSDHEMKEEENFGSPHFRPEIDRGALRKILLESLHPDTVVWDSHFLSISKEGEGWLLHFKNRNAVYADVVIAADGANSKIRPYITDSESFYSGITMLEGNIYDAKHTAPQISALLEGGKIMAFGKGQNILMGQKGNDEIGFMLASKHMKTGRQTAVSISIIERRFWNGLRPIIRNGMTVGTSFLKMRQCHLFPVLYTVCPWTSTGRLSQM